MAYTGTFLFRSTDAGAPSLTGEVGKLTDLLQAIFVDGYNNLTTGVTVAQTAGTATLTKTSHGFVAGQIIRVSGFDQAGYNIDARVLTVPTANTLTYAVDSGTVSPGTGSGAVKMCPLDWTAYGSPGTNSKAWQMPAICTNQYWLTVIDNGTGSAAYARARGYESMSGVALVDPDAGTNGTNPFPLQTGTNAISGGLYLDKSSAASATARAWMVISDRKTIYVVVNPAGTTTRSGFAFGQFVSYKSTLDSYPTFFAGNHGALGYQAFNIIVGGAPTTSNGAFFVRGYGGASGAIAGTKSAPYIATHGTTYPGAGTAMTYPAPIAGGMYVQRMNLHEVTSGADMRGHMPGLWFPYHKSPLAVDETATGLNTFTGASGSTIDGRTFYVVAGSQDGQMFFERRIGSYWD